MASHFPNEWLHKVDGHAAPYGPGVVGHATAFINALIANLAPASFPDLSARAIPDFSNGELNNMHILINGSLLETMPGAVAGLTYPVGVAGKVKCGDFHLRKCYYSAVQQGLNPQQYTVAAVGAVAYGALAAAAFGAGPIPAIAPARNITFPLLGNKTYGFGCATEQACRAMKEWFTPVAVPPSEAYAAGVAAVRRAGYDNIYLTIPNGENSGNPGLPAPRTFNVYNKAMGAQEKAWHTAFFRHISCPICDRGHIQA